MRQLVLLVILGVAACHRAMTPDQAGATITALADSACVCRDEKCAAANIDAIEELTKIVDVTKFSPRSAQAMTDWSRALSCRFKLLGSEGTTVSDGPT